MAWSPLEIGAAGALTLLVLGLLGVRIAYAAAFVGLFGLIWILGWDIGLRTAGTIPHSKGVSYSLSKRGVHLLTERWGMKLGPKGVRVVSISPGVIHTPMGLSENEQTPGAADTMNAASIGRIGTPMDIAMAARFLCSDEAGFITACDLKVDGGSTATVLSQR